MSAVIDLVAPEPAASHRTAPEDKVPMGTKVAFGFGNLVGNFTGNLTKELMTPVFVVALGLSPWLVGVALTVFNIYHAMITPVVGWLSDNTRSKWGRRRPYIVLGAVLSALAMPLMWLVQPGWTLTAIAAWLIVTGIILHTASTIHGVGFESFTLELTPDYAERTRINSVKMIVASAAGPVIGSAWLFTQLPYFHDPATGKPDILLGARVLVFVVAVVILIAGLAPALMAKERFYAAASKQEKTSLLSSLKTAFHNRAFMVLSLIAVLAVTASSMYNGIGFYTNLYYVCQGNQELAAKITSVQSMVYLPVSIAAIFMFQAISSKLGKTRTFALALFLSLLAMACRWWILRPDMPWLSLVSTVLIAMGVSGLWQLVPAMVADTVDDEELRCSMRCEGAIASVFSWFMNFSFSVGYGLPGLIVETTGFVAKAGAEQAPGVITAMRLWDAVLPSGLTVLAIALLLVYPLSAGRMAEIRSALEARRGKV
jgi:glycoside/pentoside/hexuronide:cation symporter, GPH family